jgi:AAA15 family ATPase/GTPase
LLEELENGLNPASIEKILDIMFEVAKEKNVQFLITTHSPMFLELMRNNPESVIICEQDEFGLSQYISLSEKLTMFKDDYEEGDSLIDLWFSGLIGGL